MMKTWLTRRPVRSPVSLLVTSASNSSVCRLPFISSAALPACTSSTALAAEAWLCGVDDLQPGDVEPGLLRRRDDPSAGADQYRRDQALRRRVERAPQRGFVTGMRDRGQRRRDLAGLGDQALILVAIGSGTPRMADFGGERAGLSHFRGHFCGAVRRRDPVPRPAPLRSAWAWLRERKRPAFRVGAGGAARRRMIRQHPADAFVAGERFAFERAGRGQNAVELLPRDRRRLRLQNALDRGDGLVPVEKRSMKNCSLTLALNCQSVVPSRL